MRFAQTMRIAAVVLALALLLPTLGVLAAGVGTYDNSGTFGGTIPPETRPKSNISEDPSIFNPYDTGIGSSFSPGAAGFGTCNFCNRYTDDNKP